MLTWQRKKTLARGQYILEEACFKGGQRIEVAYLAKPNHTPETHARYFVGCDCMKYFKLEATNIEEAKTEAYRKTHDWVEEQIESWHDKLMKMWKEEDWVDDVEE